MAKEIHFVITVNLEDKSKRIDDDTLSAVFYNGTGWDTDKQEWFVEEDDEYQEALAILNDKSKEVN